MTAPQPDPTRIYRNRKGQDMCMSRSLCAGDRFVDLVPTMSNDDDLLHYRADVHTVIAVGQPANAWDLIPVTIEDGTTLYLQRGNWYQILNVAATDPAR